MAHPPKRGKRAQKRGAFGPFRPKEVATLVIWHEFLTSGPLVIKCVCAIYYSEAAGQKFVPNVKLVVSPGFLGPDSPKGPI